MIWTIGYSNRTLPEFTRELEKRDITLLVDVRSRPWSRNPSFNQKAIEKWSERMGVHYRWEGQMLGGDHAERELQSIAKSISQLAKASTNESIAIMCAEGDPASCHRTWDVSVWLLRWHAIDPISILRDGNEERATQSLLRVSKGNLPDHASQYLSRQRSLF